MKIALESYSDAIKETLQNGLHAYNLSRVPDAAWKEIAITVRDDGGAIHGGVIAYLFGDNCYIDTVWNDEAARGSGVGTEMVRMAEDEARRLGASGVWLYTTSFQAKPVLRETRLHPICRAEMAGERRETPFHVQGAVRITGGAFRGRPLFAPPDARVRPTADKVRQAVFNVLSHNDFGIAFSLEDARVADLFAGTGALGIEAISRGARFCLFVDHSAESRALIRRNVEALGLTGVTKIWRRDATQLGPMPAGSGGPFTLVFLDPPYRKALLPHALTALREGGWLAPDALVVAETAADEPAVTADGFRQIDSRIYGDTRVESLALA